MHHIETLEINSTRDYVYSGLRNQCTIAPHWWMDGDARRRQLV